MILESVYRKCLEYCELNKEIVILHKTLLFTKYETGFQEGKETLQKIIKGREFCFKKFKNRFILTERQGIVAHYAT
jgi:hypothetical protein